MSPFGDVVGRLRDEIANMPQRGQVILFSTAAHVLAERRREWLQTDGANSSDVVFEQALEGARNFAYGRTSSASNSLLVEVESAAVNELSNGAPTVVQDCWICIDTAIRGPVAGYDMSSSTWYLLEPLFQSVCTRLLGVSDVGSENEAAERTVLDDPVMDRGVTAVRSCVERISTRLVDESLFMQISSDLIAIRP